MFSFWSNYITYGLVIVILLLFLMYCRNTLKVYKGFPILHLVPYLVYSQVFRKIPKDVPYSSFLFDFVVEQWKTKFLEEGLCLAYLLPKPVLLIFGKETVKVFANEKSAADKPDWIYRIFADSIGQGLVTNNGEKWKKRRKMLNPVFSLAMLKDNVSLFNEHALALVKDLETLAGKQSVDVSDYIKSHYYNALSESIFGLKQSEDNRSENIKYFHGLDTLLSSTVYRATHPWFHSKFMLNITSYGRMILREQKNHCDFVKNVILKMRNHVSSSDQTAAANVFSKNLRNSFAYILLQYHMKDPSFTLEDLHGEVRTFMAAGYDTVSYTTLWCLYTLGLYPEVQEKAYNEVQAATGDYISYEDCSSFTYLEAAILETLRLYPTIPIIGRELNQDIQCGKYKVTKGTTISFVSYLLHRNPYIYPDPEVFDPERFLGNAQNNSWDHIPFAEGVRTCIGKKYALLEMKVFLAYILRNFRITSLDRREDIKLCWNIILTPSKPLRMHIELR